MEDKPNVPSASEFFNFGDDLQKTAIISTDVDRGTDYQISYGELAGSVRKAVCFLRKELGLKEGDTVSYLFENCPEIVVLNLACFLSGFRVCPLDARRDTAEVAARKLEETKTSVLFYRKSQTVEQLVGKLENKKGLRFFGVADFFDLTKILGDATDEGFLRITNPQNTALILYTSGTTGFPKGTMLSLANIYFGALQVARWFDIRQNDRFYLVLPLHHINSTIFAQATLLRRGLLVIPSRYTRSRFFSHMARYGATMSSIVPTINLDLLEQEEDYRKNRDILKIKRIQIGSAPVSASHTIAFYKKYGIRLIQGYGSTETSLRITGVPVDIPEDEYLTVLQQNSVGIPLVFNEVKIIDSEICVKGLNVMQGYLNREKETKEVLTSGYFHTGDIGYEEEIGGKKYYFLKGRRKEIIIKGGVNISPLFIEERLREQFAWMRDVVVVGFPHYRLGEEIGAIFIPKRDNYQNDFRHTIALLKNYAVKNLSRYETPKVAMVAKDEEIAKTATGKVQHIKVEKDFENKLVFASKYLGENKSHYFRIITPDEEMLLKKEVGIHNDVFPHGLELSFEELVHRATNGFVIGAFVKKDRDIQGVLTGFFSEEEFLRSGKNWDEITDRGTFQNSIPKGSAAVLVSAASASSRGKQRQKRTRDFSMNLSLEMLKRYVDSEKDYVVRFHRSPKAGFSRGASVYRFIMNGNPNDKESCGVIVIFKYPSLSTIDEVVFTQDKIGIGLVEAAIKYAKEKGKKKAFALSRFGELYKHVFQSPF